MGRLIYLYKKTKNKQRTNSLAYVFYFGILVKIKEYEKYVLLRELLS